MSSIVCNKIYKHVYSLQDMEKGVISIIFISLFIFFASVSLITAFVHLTLNGDLGVCSTEDECGDDGAGGVCGICDSGFFCVDRMCVECSDDGDCASGESCDASGSCVAGGATTCNDPDGLDYYVRETCTDSTGTTITDLCTLDGTILYEASCETGGDDSFCVSLIHNCPAGEVCLDGACVDSVRSSCDTYIIVSNRSTLIDGNMAIPSVTISAWTNISGAIWIWEEATVSTPTVNRTVVFTKTFHINDLAPGIIGGIDGELVIAADNSYSCTLNGLFVGADESEDNFRDDTKDIYGLDETRLNVGENILVCEVKNWGQEGGTSSSNPAGLLYRLEVNNGICMIEAPTCTDTDGGVNYLSPGIASTDEDSNTDSCSADGSTLTEYFCDPLGEIISIEFDCNCVDDGEGGYCELSGTGLVCEAFNSHLEGELIDVADMVDFVDEDIQDLLITGEIVSIKLTDAPVRSRVANEVTGNPYYCGLDLLWHRAKPTVQDIGCINDPSLDCDSNTACLEDYECGSNSCVDGYCISISAELIAQRSILLKIWCVVTNLPSFISDGQSSLEYLTCVDEGFGGA